MAQLTSNETFRGLLVSWLAVALPATTALLVFFLENKPDYHTLAQAVGEALFWALAVALIFGTVGYALVRTGQTVGQDNLPWIDRFLLGQDRQEATYWMIGVGIFSVLVFVALAVLNQEVLEVQRTLGNGISGEALLVIPLIPSVLSLWHGYRNDGVLVGWALISLPMFAYLLFVFAFPVDPRPTRLATSALVAGLLALGVGAVFGTIGSVLGSSLRRLTTTQPTNGHRV